MLLPMPLLRMREATFDAGEARAGPVTLDLELGEIAALHFASAREAAVLARMASAVVRASSGCVLVADYDPHVQSVACKRIAALVPHEPFALTENEFARYIEYRAALWKVEPSRARSAVARLRRQLAGMHEALAYPLIGALIGSPKLLVLDRPQPVYARQILVAAGDCAVLSTHDDAAAARAFAPKALHFLRAIES
jgi:ABC-type Na+ transport system ATPase subunit NatA